MTRIEWINGWPVLNGGKPILLSESFGKTPDQKYPPAPFKDTFTGKRLDPSWYQFRIPYTKNYQLGISKQIINSGIHSVDKSRKGGVAFNPNVFSLSDRDTPAAIVRKQKSLNMTFSATLLPTDGSLGYKQSVGISIYLSEFQHQDIGIRGCVNQTGMCIYSELLMNGTSRVSRPIISVALESH